MNAMDAATVMPSTNTKTKLGMLPWLICFLGALFYCYEYFLRIAPSAMHTELMRAYGVNATSLGALVAFYYHAYVPMQLPVGMMMDRMGPRRLLTFACLICVVGAYFFTMAHSYSIGASGRLLVGLGSAFAFVGVLKLARVWLPEEHFGMASGVAAALGVVGGFSGDILLPYMVNAVGWRVTHYIFAAVGLGLALLIFSIVRDHNPNKSIEDEEFEGAEMKEVWKNFLELIRLPQLWLIGFIGCALYLPTTAFAEFWAIPYFEQARDLSPHAAGFAVSVLFIGWGIGAPLSGWISDKFQTRRVPMVMGGLIGLVLGSILIFAPDLSRTTIYILMFFFGMSYSVQVLVFAAACDICSPRAAGTAIATTNMVVMLGGSISQPLIGKILDWEWGGLVVDGVRHFSLHEFQIALTVLPVGLFLAAIAAYVLKTKREEESPALQSRMA